jgi:hypothetical protein
MHDVEIAGRLKKLQGILHCCLLRRTKCTRMDGNKEPIVSLPPRIVNREQPDFTLEERSLYQMLEERSNKRFDRLMGTFALNSFLYLINH